VLGHGAVRAGMAAGVVACARGPLLLPRPPMEVVPALLPPSISLSSAACRPRGTNGGAAAAGRITTAGTNGGAADPCAAEFGRPWPICARQSLAPPPPPSRAPGGSAARGPAMVVRRRSFLSSFLLIRRGGPLSLSIRLSLSVPATLSAVGPLSLRAGPPLCAAGRAVGMARAQRHAPNLACKSCSGRQHFFRYPAQHAANVAHSVRDTVRQCRQS